MIKMLIGKWEKKNRGKQSPLPDPVPATPVKDKENKVG
jgi:hypothetical protein